MGAVNLAAEIHNVAFSKPPFGQRGYDDQDVDEFLDWLEGAVATGVDTATVDERISQVAFARPPVGKRGYHPEEVDTFLDYVRSACGASGPNVAPGQDGSPPSNAAAAQPSAGLPGLSEGQRGGFRSSSGSAVVEHKGFFQRLFGR